VLGVGDAQLLEPLDDHLVQSIHVLQRELVRGDAEGVYAEVRLGLDVAQGETPQALIPARS
jgi:predicted cupin superfamily sugar epimerase